MRGMERVATLLAAAVLAVGGCASTPPRPPRPPALTPAPVTSSPAATSPAASPTTSDVTVSVTPGGFCATSRLGKTWKSPQGVTYTCKGPKPYRWRP